MVDDAFSPVLGFSWLDRDAEYPAVFGSVHEEAWDGRVVGTLWGGEHLVVEVVTDRTMRIVDAGTGEWHHLNRNRDAAEVCLAAFHRYAHSGAPTTAPTMMTAEQAAAKLAAFRAGAIVPAQSVAAPATHDERLAALRAALGAADPAALEDSCWWSGPLEEAADDLL
ncbi:hypothetical protein [Leucobacter japonicus]|uniref:hypothetical protein n=1 Tax=Leucobacter japonicus TaxID=1461259 RepID=UPI0006A7B46B|nr:hypothetical protein [Leucobacter japonicus]